MYFSTRCISCGSKERVFDVFLVGDVPNSRKSSPAIDWSPEFWSPLPGGPGSHASPSESSHMVEEHARIYWALVSGQETRSLKWLSLQDCMNLSERASSCATPGRELQAPLQRASWPSMSSEMIL